MKKLIAVIVILIAAALVAFFLFKKKSGSGLGPVRSRKTSEPLTPGTQPYRSGTY